MKIALRFISLILAFVMVSSTLLACGKGNDPSGTDDKNSNSSASDTEEVKFYENLPDKDWGGAEYRILGREFAENNFKNFEVDYDEMPEDVVGLSVWNRNAAIKAKYGLDVVGKFVNEATTATAKLALETGDDQYDLILCPNNQLHPFAIQGYLINISDLKYVNLEKNCWNDYANEQLTMGGKLYYTTNKFLLQDKHRTWMLWYNRTMAEELNLGYLEDEVFAGTWTMDRLIEISKQGSSEFDGADGMTFGDKWGVTFSSSYCFAQLVLGTGFRISEKGADGYPQLVGATDQMISYIDKVMELTNNTDSCFINGIRPTAEDSQASGATIFTEGRAVIMGHAISFIDNLHNLEFEYGAIPNPKFNVEQESYYTVPNVSNGSLFAVPSTVYDLDKAGFGLQAISEESADTSYYAYIETRCKLQDAYDEDMAKCLGMIFDGVVYDIAFINDFGGLGNIVRSSLVESGGMNIYASQFKRKEKMAKNELSQIKEKYLAQ